VIETPAAPLGDQTPIAGTLYSFYTTDVPSHWGGPVEYRFDWGDGTTSPWLSSPAASHSWSVPGRKTITVSARRRRRPDVSASSEGYVVLVRPDGHGAPGVDVSHHQNDKNAGVIDWTRVYAIGKRFAFIKATDGYTEGKGCPNGTDPRFRTNMDGARKAGLLVAPYHFGRPHLHPDATVEARQFVRVAGDYIAPGCLRPVLDFENPGDVKSPVNYARQLGKEGVSKWIRDWANEVKRLTGVEPMLYINRMYASKYVESDIARYPLWIAGNSGDPGKAPGDLGPWARNDFMQYDWKGSIPGINGPIDFDMFNGDMESLAKLVIRDEKLPTIPQNESRGSAGSQSTP